MRIIRESDRMDIVLDTEKKEIIVTQKWKYIWQTPSQQYVSDWQPDEQDKFLLDTRDLIQRFWNDKIYFTAKSVQGKKSAFADNYAGTKFNVRVDIQKVISREHWTVFVQKVWQGSTLKPIVRWNQREITLTSRDTREVAVDLPDKSAYNIQYTVAHEFGHALGNVGYAKEARGDEYVLGHPFFHDTDSIMCIGNEVRRRHYRYLRARLQRMLPDTLFDMTLY